MKEKLKANIKVRLPEELHNELLDHATSQHLDLSDVARRAFREFIDRSNRKFKKRVA